MKKRTNKKSVSIKPVSVAAPNTIDSTDTISVTEPIILSKETKPTDTILSNASTDKSKPLFSFHIHCDKEKKAIYIHKIHAYAICTVAAFFICTAVYSAYNYYNSKKALAVSSQQLEALSDEKKQLEQKTVELEQKTAELEAQNSHYNQNITQLQQKAAEIETKINNLEKVKEDLYDQISKADTSAVVMTASMSAEENPSSRFTKLIFTPYEKVSALSDSLAKLDGSLEEEEVTFIDVADTVTQTLANAKATPAAWPVQGQISSQYSTSPQAQKENGRMHKGLDIRCPMNSPVWATADGKVTTAQYSNSYGYMVRIDHGNGYETLYAHNSSLAVSAGDTVKRGDTIAYSGQTGYATGPHVHYEVTYNGEYRDPTEFLAP